jgi:transcriptional regulator with XRE-family HTH domain
MTLVDHSKHCEFGILCKTYRDKRNLRQREVAERVGIGLSSYGNVESAPHRVISRARAESLADVFDLSDHERAGFLDAFERAPLSEYTIKNRARWDRRNKMRSKAKHHDRLFVSLIEMTSMFLMVCHNDADLCVCGFDGKTEADPTRSCELCTALEALGLDPFSTREDLVSKLGHMQDRIEAEAEAAKSSKAPAA